MDDNITLVHIQHGGVTFDALVNECNTVTAIFYDDCDITNLMRFFTVDATDEIIALSVTEAMKARVA